MYESRRNYDRLTYSQSKQGGTSSLKLVGPQGPVAFRWLTPQLISIACSLTEVNSGDDSPLSLSRSASAGLVAGSSCALLYSSSSWFSPHLPFCVSAATESVL
ncbi:hypothetical protein K1719_024699 [Acacia pycnantha]|nr:hypothetical protein K1719_024699 [Acacia pycnantha]